MAGPQDALVFAPLGGVGEIGMNLAVYGVGEPRRRKWLIVDCGVSFAQEEHLPGVDVIFPDIRFLVEERRNLVGLILTHAHEDHFGAVLELWPKLQIPVYATPFTAALLTAKQQSEPGAPDIPLNVIKEGARLDIGPFDIELVSMAHSIPESSGLILRTPHGNVLHTGDWKIDPTPVVGPPTDEAKLRALGEEGCAVLIGDSTNAVRDGRSPSESEVARSLAEIIKAAPRRVAVTTFASNVGRLRAIAEAAHAADREVVLVGRAMERVVQVARETGYLDGIGPFRSQDTYGYLPPDKVLALCTGSQGEARAALSRIAQDQHPDVTLSRGDMVIFSSRTIPGNEKAVGRVLNGLIEQGIEIITDRTHLVHVSGHPRQAEMEDLLGWVKPTTVIPVHGEMLHMHEHARLAKRLGLGVLTCRNGDVVQLVPGPPAIIDEVPTGRLYKDGAILIAAQGKTLAERRRLASGGIVVVALAVTDKGVLGSDPQIELIGIPETAPDGDAMFDIVLRTVERTMDSLPKARRRDPDALAESVRRSVRAAVASHWGKKPNCLVQVLDV